MGKTSRIKRGGFAIRVERFRGKLRVIRGRGKRNVRECKSIYSEGKKTKDYAKSKGWCTSVKGVEVSKIRH